MVEPKAKFCITILFSLFFSGGKSAAAVGALVVATTADATVVYGHG